MKTIIIALICVSTMLISTQNIALAGPYAAKDVVVGRAIDSSEQVSMDRIDHSPWSVLLQKYVNESGNVNYQSWKASAADLQSLENYLNSLSAASRTVNASQSAKLAFWINAYNAVTIKGILREYPTTSIRNHTARFVGYNIWKNLLLVVGDTQISLDAMEHQHTMQRSITRLRSRSSITIGD